MNKLIQSALMLSLCLSSNAWAETLTVVIDSKEASVGHLMVRVLQGEAEYGLQVMHDQNDNGNPAVFNAFGAAWKVRSKLSSCSLQ
ncbi:MAG: hypothetical protein ACI9HY_004265 [Planctomycetaceae bacterium]|jgi:hypothetical protein